jgi:hypothetical protein
MSDSPFLIFPARVDVCRFDNLVLFTHPGLFMFRNRAGSACRPFRLC